MHVATQLIFHDVARSEWIEAYVTERLGKLDRLASGITSCRLTLTREQCSHHQGNLYSVLVEVRLPPHHDLAVKKQQAIKESATQLHALITQGFEAIERKLQKTVEQRRNDGKDPERVSRSRRNRDVSGDWGAGERAGSVGVGESGESNGGGEKVDSRSRRWP